MSKQVYISADYAPNDGDQEVIDELHTWGSDNKHKTDFFDTAQVASGSVSDGDDCRYCDLKGEFNRQIKASSAVIFVIGDKTASRTAGSGCERNRKQWCECTCTPYKQNTNGTKQCKAINTYSVTGNDVGNVNSYSYLRHEFEEAKRLGKPIIIVYNSFYNKASWLPSYMSDYEENAHPFWKYNALGYKVGDYQYIKAVLGYE